MKKFYLFVLSIILQSFLKVNSTEKKEEDLSPFDVIWRENQKQLNLQKQETFGEEQKGQQKVIPELFEGDIVMTDELNRTIEDLKYAYKTNTTPYDAIRGGQWPRGVVPYVFARGFNSRGRQVVRQAIAHYKANVPCVTWKPRSNERRYVTFFHGGGCYSMIGRQGGPQRISLANPGCLGLGVTVHEMMHCLGFYHEQSRRDRDKWIIINWQNMNPRMKYNFEKYRYGQASTLGEPYDKKSVMHYGNYAFSINGGMTIVSKRSRNEKLGQRRGLSRIDIRQLNKYYKCGGTTTKPKPRPKPKSGCKDTYAFCVAFGSSSNRKWCSTSWLSKYCRRTCKRCPPPPRPKPKPKPKKICTNLYDKKKLGHCAYWAKQGLCKGGSILWMRANCKKSCVC